MIVHVNATSHIAERARDAGSLAGRYEGRARFDLRWDEASGGYRRTFEPSRWTWDEARLWTPAEARAEIFAGRWRLVRRLVA